MTKLKIRDIVRYARPYSHAPQEIDGFKNHFNLTNLPGSKQALLEKGINPIAPIIAADGKRTPAILIRSSPHKIGTKTTPWQDFFDVDNGYIRYFGDNKLPGADPARSPGNKILLNAFETYNDAAKRHQSIPVIFYKSVTRNGKSKGFLEFNGYGIIKSVELIAQYDRSLDRTFSNFSFGFQVFSIKAELTKSEQIPAPDSIEARTLKEVYNFYSSRKSRFEGLASAITTKIMNDLREGYVEGWITPTGSDGGADFYGRLEIGSGFGKAKIILLGQAKCENPTIPTGGNHIARTAARLKRGWLGIYVTTSFFSEAVQREIIEDGYPIMLVNGKKLAEMVLKILLDERHAKVETYLNYVDSTFDSRIQIRRPEELLFE